jgi:hypothetical protein
MTVNGTLTKEDFEIIKFIEDSTPFTMLLGKYWIDRDQARKKEEEEILEQKRQELKDFMTRRIVQLIEEQENISKLFDTRSLDVKAARSLEDSQKIEISVSNIEEVLPLNPRKESQQREVPMPKENKNQNGKRITETKLMGKKARNLSNKKANIEKLWKIPDGSLQKENLWNLNFAEISEQRHRALHHGKAI